MEPQLNEAIFRTLEEDGPLTGPELATELERHPLTVQRHCRKLQTTGRIRCTTGGGYVLKEGERPNEPVASD